MANCPECQKLLYAGAKKCTCGWKKPKPQEKRAEPSPWRPEYATGSDAETRRAFSAKLKEVESYLARYPGKTKREACLQYMKEKGLIGTLPKHFIDVEARLEREAIQNE